MRSEQFASVSGVVFGSFPGGSNSKASVYNAGDPGLIPGLGRSPGEGNGSPLQDYCLENPMDRGAWYRPWGRKESDTTEQLHFTSLRSQAACRHKPYLTGSSLLEIKVYFCLLSIFLTLSSEIIQNPGWENRPLFMLSLHTPN